jgi:hypothetical protein
VLRYLLIAVFLFPIHSEVFCSDGEIFPGQFFITCTDDADLPYAKGDYVENTPVFPFNDMLIVKDDSDLFKFRLHTHFLFNYNCRKYRSHSCKRCLKNTVEDHNIHSPDYYIYALEKIII